MSAGHLLEEALHFLFCQDGGQTSGLFGTYSVQRAQTMVEHFAIDEQQSTEGVILCGAGDVPGYGQVGEKGFDLGRAHLGGVADAVEADVAFDPVDVGFLGADGVIPQGDATRCLRRMASRTRSNSFLPVNSIKRSRYNLSNAQNSSIIGIIQ